MKRLISAFLILLFLTSLTACGGERPPAGAQQPEPGSSQNTPAAGTVPEHSPEPDTTPVPAPTPLRIMKGEGWCDEWDDNYNQLCVASWEDIALLDDRPELASVLYEWNTDQSVGAYSFLHEWRSDAEEMLAQTPEYFGGFTSASGYTVQRADSRIFSVREDFSSYTGGVHGNYGAVGWTFDTATGAQLELQDVLTDTDGLDVILAEKLRAKYPFEPMDSLNEMLMDYAPEDYTWTMDYQGITFYFSPYEIASYAAGLLTATIWFDEMPERFREEYTIAPECGYAMALPNWSEIEFDRNSGDEIRDTLSFWTQDNEYGERKLVLDLNGEEYVEENWCAFNIAPYLVCVEEQFYLYVEAMFEGDFGGLHVYDLNGSSPQRIEEYPGLSFRGIWSEETDFYYTVVFNDPAELMLGTRCHLLGTKTAGRTYAVDADGTLHPVDEAFVLDESLPPITSSVPLDVTILPENKVETIPAGTDFFFLRTDNESYVDLKMTDGRECRIVIEEIDGVPSVNGIPEWDCFDNLLYAG